MTTYKSIGYMATYPGRSELVPVSVNSVANQLDHLYVCFNQYESIPNWVKNYSNITPWLPNSDLKDLGKFGNHQHEHDDIVFTLDDDIIYPYNYVGRMMNELIEYGMDSAVGVHGVIFSDLFFGDVSERLVLGYKRQLNSNTRVNLVGTGTLCTWGKNFPLLNDVEDTCGHVDVGFANYAYSNNIKIYCLSRPVNWLRDVGRHSETLFSSNGSVLPVAIINKIRAFGGFSRLGGDGNVK